MAPLNRSHAALICWILKCIRISYNASTPSSRRYIKLIKVHDLPEVNAKNAVRVALSGNHAHYSKVCHHICHYDVIKWKHFPRYWPFVQGIHWSPVNFPMKNQ